MERLSNLIITEATRNASLNKSKTSVQGKIRFNKRRRSQVLNRVSDYKKIDMNQFFKSDELVVEVGVHGETNDYVVKIMVEGVLKELQKDVNTTTPVKLQQISRALVRAFNSENVYFHCSCPDFEYRFSYWSTKNNTNSGPQQPSNGKWIRNPDDSLGSGCKHVLLVLSNTRWISKVASVINNYIKYIQNHQPGLYYDIIYPALYGEEYTEPVQLSLFDNEDGDLDSSEETVSTANAIGAVSGRFRKGNNKGIQPSTE